MQKRTIILTTTHMQCLKAKHRSEVEVALRLPKLCQHDVGSLNLLPHLSLGPSNGEVPT